ncbi:thiol reductant ABC exporter subunit CydD [Pelagibacterium flavum]|uniref:Thiol reductant ABC exporter subunit CydD n=1 Tax=Pelagibacterium flavum TaxID=2984530 RepID=A0ABY6IS24_9HYPH|nr:thiol reductant ABC exporter subunit CydD [Pelagibacterium sp. YIM 151497]UYQ73199.1 thiol reductant ABC exporter subunit CydD [Pelagibacterium sp. YIM 151497]
MASPTDTIAPAKGASNLMGLRTLGGHALTLAIVTPLVSGVLLVVYAWLLAQTLGRTIEDGESLAAVMGLIGAMAVIILARAVLGMIGEQAGTIGAQAIKKSLRDRLFSHLLAQRHALGLKPASGAVAAALIDQVDGLENFFARYLPAMIAAAILPVAFAVVLFPIDWVVALLFLFTAPLIPVFMALAGWGAQAATDRQANALSRLSAHFADRLRGLLTLKLFGREADAINDVHAASEALRRRTNAVLRIAFLSSAILEFFAALGVAGVALYVGLTYLGFLGINPGLTLSAGLLALIMAPEVYAPLRQLAAHYHDRATARSALAEIGSLVAAPDALQSADLAPPAAAGKPAAGLTINGLTVQTALGTPILNALDLDLPPSKTLAIMGPSGIGKSTLARAITRLIPFDGAIGLDGRPVADWSEPDLRGALAFIAQKPRIFTGTIAENIGFADPLANRAAIASAADRALVTAFATALPDGLDTLVGEGGYGLSGGQIQRIGLARLFLTDPALIILDEPTAHLDPETEAQVLDQVFAFAAGRTLIILTHSATVAARADSVLRMAGGKLLATPHRAKPSASRREDRA